MQYEKHILKNGLRVIIVPMKNTESVVFQVLVKTGAKNEDKKVNGISHFLEHLVFKGTKKYPKPSDINKTLDRIGAEHNAFTGKEVTGFWVKLAVKDFDIGLNVVSDMVLNPTFDTKEIERERGVILQEISLYEDRLEIKAVEDLESMVFKNSSMDRVTLGTNESVKSITRNEIIRYRKDRYTSENMVVIVAGNVDKHNVLKNIEKIFRNLKNGKNRGIEKNKFGQKEIIVKFKDKKCDQSHVAIGIRSYDMFDDRRYAIDLLAIILGGNMSSRLFVEVREKRGLAYYVGASDIKYEGGGYLRIRAGVPKEKLYVVFNIIAKILNDIKKKGVSKNELHFAKEFVRGRMALSLEGSDEVADFFGEQELFHDKILTPQEIMKKIEKVTASDIMKVVKDIFRPENINITGIIPEDGKSIDTDKIRNIFLK